jgi:hypothetical protein
MADVDPWAERSPQPENAKLSKRYMNTIARTIATTTVTITSFTGRSCALVTLPTLPRRDAVVTQRAPMSPARLHQYDGQRVVCSTA